MTTPHDSKVVASEPMFDRGYRHFLQGLFAPSSIVRTYPTRDRHSADEEAEFIAGFTKAKCDHEQAEMASKARGHD